MPRNTAKATSDPMDALSAFDAVVAQPTALKPGSIRCMIDGCGGAVKPEYIYTFSDEAGNEHQLGVCGKVDTHLLLRASGAISPEAHRRAMKVNTRARAQHASK